MGARKAERETNQNKSEKKHGTKEIKQERKQKCAAERTKCNIEKKRQKRSRTKRSDNERKAIQDEKVSKKRRR